jgi:hypothetical protein
MLNEILWLSGQDCGSVWGMKMRCVLVVIGGLCLGLSGNAIAYENFIPLGTGYSSNVDSVPEFDSEAGVVASESDVYETELYKRQRKQIEEESRFKQFFSNTESTGADSYIDY